MPPAIYVGSDTDDGPTAFTFAIPTAARAGDAMIMVVATEDQSIGNGLADELADGVEVLGELETAQGQIFVLRYVVTGEETSGSVVVDLQIAAVADRGGAMVCYRGLETAAPSGAAAAVNVAGSTSFPAPSQTLVRYSDLYLGIVFSRTAIASLTAPAGTTERVEFYDGASDRLQIFELLQEAPGPTGIRTTAANVASSGIAASIALAATGLVGVGKVIVLDPPGGIGLPTEGI